MRRTESSRSLTPGSRTVRLQAQSRCFNSFQKITSVQFQSSTAKSLVLVSAAVRPATNLAVGRHLRIIHVVPYRVEGLEVGENGREVFVRHAAVGMPWHDLAEVPGLHPSGANCLSEEGLVVVGNPRRIGSDVRARHPAPRAIENQSAAKFQSW